MDERGPCQFVWRRETKHRTALQCKVKGSTITHNYWLSKEPICRPSRLLSSDMLNTDQLLISQSINGGEISAIFANIKAKTCSELGQQWWSWGLHSVPKRPEIQRQACFLDGLWRQLRVWSVHNEGLWNNPRYHMGFGYFWGPEMVWCRLPHHSLWIQKLAVLQLQYRLPSNWEARILPGLTGIMPPVISRPLCKFDPNEHQYKFYWD